MVLGKRWRRFAVPEFFLNGSVFVPTTILPRYRLTTNGSTKHGDIITIKDTEKNYYPHGLCIKLKQTSVTIFLTSKILQKTKTSKSGVKVRHKYGHRKIQRISTHNRTLNEKNNRY